MFVHTVLVIVTGRYDPIMLNIERQLFLVWRVTITRLRRKAVVTHMIERGAQYLKGENLEVVWAEFSTLS
jgi:hypothetical protein